MSLKKLLLRLVPYKVLKPVRDLVYPEKISVLEERLNNLFFTYYQDVAASDLDQKTVFKNVEFKVYSKHGGDGILLYIFSKIGTVNHTFVEMGIEDGRECNTANLALNFGWKGLMIDGNKKWVRSAQRYLKEKLKDAAESISVVASFITAENINKTLKENDVVGDIDLLSMDIDGNDYWVWEAITIVNPRVVVAEYNAAFALQSVTIPYDPKFNYGEISDRHPLYFGASLPALVKLAKKKGYRLVACDTHGHDAYFVRNDVAGEVLKELSPEEAFYPNPYTLSKIGSVDEQFGTMKNLEFREI